MLGQRASRGVTAAVAVMVAVLVAGPAVGQRFGGFGPSPASATLAPSHDHTALDVAHQHALDHDAEWDRITRVAAANGLTPANGKGPCGDLFQFRTPAGVQCSSAPMLRSMFTADQLAEADRSMAVREAGRAEPAAVASSGTASLATTTSASDPKVTCFGNGTDGKRVGLVYARRQSTPDGSAAATTALKQWAAEIEQTMVLSAQKTGGVRKVRWLTDANCVATVQNVTVADTVTTFGGLVSALQSAGLNSSSRKYVVAWDYSGAGSFCGLGQKYDDSSPGSLNKNEVQQLGSMFAAVGPACWSGQVAAHELMHTLGAVQNDAPHSTKHGHCTDESDIMCYVDYPTTVLSQVCPTSQEDLYDCNNDDYFNTNPPAGNYLKTHWNSANSGWLDATGSVGPPTAPRNVTIAPSAGGTVQLTWTAPAYDGGSAVQSYLVRLAPGSRTVAVPAPATGTTIAGLADGVAVSASVSAVNVKGEGASEVTAEVIPSPLVFTRSTSEDSRPYRAMSKGPAGSVYVSDTDRILRVDPDGTETTIVGGTGTGENTAPLATTVSPEALAVAPNGDLYFFDADLGKLRRLSGGHVNSVAGNGTFANSGDGGPATSAGIEPDAIAINPVDNAVLFVETRTDVVRRFTPGGTITRVAGTTGTAGFAGDGGPATAAKFDSPRDIAVDSSGNVYVADTNNQYIRKFTVGGNITSVAGDGTNQVQLADQVDASSGVPFPRAIDWSSERGLLIDTFGLIRRLSGTKLIHFAGVLLDNTASDADGTPAGSIAYGKTDFVQGIVYSTNVFHVLASGTNPATSAGWTRVRSAGPWSVAAPATAPEAPPKLPIATAGQESATVTWVPPSNGGSDITGYQITTSPGGAVTAAGPTATKATVSGLTPGTPYTFTVAAVNAVGTGTPSAPSNAVTPTARPAYWPFASWSAFVARQYTDLIARTPTSSESASWVSLLASSAKTKGDLDDALRRSSENTTNVDPVARLYRAFLGRAPDASGLKFWIKRRRSGDWTLTRIADYFANSNEFTTKYGTLTNRQFVTRIYTDVLGRAADTAGVNYWTGKLDRHEKTRGGVMVGFSESSEYKRKQAENTDVAVAYIYLLGRSPTAAETSDWTTREKAGTATHAALLTELLDSAGYGTHVTG